jgi:uncharacterized protein YciI
MSDEERAVWAVPFERLRRIFADGTVIVVGPSLGPKNIGICIFEAPDEDAARRIMAEDPVITGGFAERELRPFKLSLLRGRDWPRLDLRSVVAAGRDDGSTDERRAGECLINGHAIEGHVALCPTAIEKASASRIHQRGTTVSGENPPMQQGDSRTNQSPSSARRRTTYSSSSSRIASSSGGASYSSSFLR